MQLLQSIFSRKVIWGLPELNVEVQAAMSDLDKQKMRFIEMCSSGYWHKGAEFCRSVIYPPITTPVQIQ